jgi:formate hydrogenlyase subunit 3/multisubunit Na+/H+ antiporter MnhD subunit
MSPEVFLFQDPGALLVVALALPVAGILFVLLAGGHYARGIALALLVAGIWVAAAIAAGVWRTGDALTYLSGGWAPPLGIKLRADGLSAAMLLMTSIVVFAVGWYAPREFAVPPGKPETRVSLSFWILLLSVWAAMNAVFLGNDFFNLYVALELVTFAGVPLVCLSGSAATLAAALRYLLFALIGSALYLLGAVLLYGSYGTLDLGLLARQVRPEMALWLAISLMTAGLAAKTALFPVYIWLPPAHSGAPPGASALLSALVVKGSFFLVVRLWFDVAPGVPGAMAGQILGAMGAGAIVLGGVVALRQARLKLMIAYSTVAQLGYLFLIFPLATDANALTGGIFQTISHAFAKAAMFMAAGIMAEAVGHDRIADLRGVGRMMPLTVCAFGLAALSLVGVPPSGGFFAKWLLLSASFALEQWWWAVAILVGGLLAGGYMFRALAPALADVERKLTMSAPVSRAREIVVLALAVCALLVGLFPEKSVELLQIGRAHSSRVALP